MEPVFVLDRQTHARIRQDPKFIGIECEFFYVWDHFTRRHGEPDRIEFFYDDATVTITCTGYIGRESYTYPYLETLVYQDDPVYRAHLFFVEASAIARGRGETGLDLFIMSADILDKSGPSTMSETVV